MVQLEGLDELKKFNDLIWTPTGDLPACSIAPQSSMLALAPNEKQHVNYESSYTI
jgi:hypothetical protein